MKKNDSAKNDFRLIKGEKRPGTVITIKKNSTMLLTLLRRKEIKNK